MTQLLNLTAAQGTGYGARTIRLADGNSLSLAAGPRAACEPAPGENGVPDDYAGPFTSLEVYLFPGLDAPAGADWRTEVDTAVLVAAHITAKIDGRLFLTVPVDAVRALIEAHGGEDPDRN
ncbi:hypothetical protein [Streptomyces sp. NRRL S-350]|uniref:hypothetical protein n=1 Tax=Streptomyces sp. NRRL S-350 TaxID=1463902 RepID=UPI00055EFA6C|nr:hypothetical protein [Streptomyces sp. NRRL S-350]